MHEHRCSLITFVACTCPYVYISTTSSSSILLFSTTILQLKLAQESIEARERERERGEFPSSPYSNRYRLARVMRAIHHSPRLDKPRREEKQTFPPRWIHVAVGQDKCAYILKEPRTCYRDGRKRRSVTGDPERKREAIRMDAMNEQR